MKITRFASRPTMSPAGASCLVAALIVIGIVSSDCAPFHGLAQLDIPSDPIHFIDERTGDIITEVLVLPRYSSSSGASTGAGHGPGAMDHTVYVADPFIYRAGDEFQPMQPKSSGMVVSSSSAFLGTGRSIDGVFVVAPGYTSRFVSELWSNRPETLALTPLSKPAALAELDAIQRLLDLQIVNGEGKLRWDLGGEQPLYVRLTDKGRQLTGQFITQGLAKLNDHPDP